MIKAFPQLMVTYEGQTVPRIWRWPVVFVPYGQPLDIDALQKTVKKVTKKYCKKPDLLMATFNAGHELQVTALKNDVCKIYGTAIDIGTSGVTTLPIDLEGNVSSAINYSNWILDQVKANVNVKGGCKRQLELTTIAKAASVNKNITVSSNTQNGVPNLMVNLIDSKNTNIPELTYITAEAFRDKLLSGQQAIYQLDGEKLFVDCIFVGYLAVYGFPGEKKETAYLKQAGVIRDVNNNQNNFPIPLIGLLSDVAIERLALYKKIYAK